MVFNIHANSLEKMFHAIIKCGNIHDGRRKEKRNEKTYCLHKLMISIKIRFILI